MHRNKENPLKALLVKEEEIWMTAASYLLSAFSQDTQKDARPGKQHSESVTQLSLAELVL